MKVYNQDKTQVLTEYDLAKGWLKPDVIDVPEVEGVKEEWHYEVVREYANGGKDVRRVVDKAGVEHQPAHQESIYVYVPYTEQELTCMKSEERIQELKILLAQTDYQAIKWAEGELTDYEYAETKNKRKAWRAEINELEEIIDKNK